MSLPNQLTVLRILLTPVVITLLRFEGFYFRCASLLVFLIAALTDWYDGRMARKFGITSKWGSFLDPLADKILILSTLSAFAFYEHIPIWVVVTIASRDILITCFRLYARWKNKPVVTSASAKWKTASQMTAIHLILLYLIADAYFAQLIKPTWLRWINEENVVHTMILIVTAITIYTAIQYFIENRHHVRTMLVAFIRVFAPGNLAK